MTEGKEAQYMQRVSKVKEKDRKQIAKRGKKDIRACRVLVLELKHESKPYTSLRLCRKASSSSFVMTGS